MRPAAYMLLLVIIVALAATASADIFQWTDDAGVVHYTNLKGQVPSQQPAQVVVDEQVWLPHDSPVPDTKDDPVAQLERTPDTEDEVVFRAYLAGLESGLGRNVSTGGSVYINGPLAVTISSPMPYDSYVLPRYDWRFPGYYPFWGTALIGPIHGRFGHVFHRRFPAAQHFFGAAGPPPFGAPGPPPVGAAGPPPFGAAGGSPLGASGSRFLR